MLQFTEEEIKRYSRHIILPEVGGVGQKKLKEAKILVAGAGGLGSPASLYLAAAGIGLIGIIDMDIVDISNLQRQILHRTEDIGREKTLSAERSLKDINPDIEVRRYQERISADNIMDIIKDYDLIIDGVDNFPARYLLNDACFFLSKPLVDAGILRFDGQLMTIIPNKGPCYRCIFPEPPPPGMVPSCQEAGILGAVAGILGVLQATEAIKYILGKGELLVGKILIFDALALTFRIINISKNKDCPLCGVEPKIKELKEYDIRCEVN
jgi:adenylyltransferase/sulfurtransferase